MRLEIAHAKAERIINEDLRRLGWPEGQFASPRKRDPGNLEIAVRLRKQTTLTLKDIVAHLQPENAGQCQPLPVGGTQENNRSRANPRAPSNLKGMQCRGATRAMTGRSGVVLGKSPRDGSRSMKKKHLIIPQPTKYRTF